MKRILLCSVALLLASLPLLAQSSRPTAKKASPRRMGLARPLVFEPGKEVYGAHLQGKTHLSLKAMMKQAEALKGRTVQLRGKIDSVCSKKGCWMIVKDGDLKVRVKFLDYAFFVPLDCAGRDVVAEGTVAMAVVSEAQRRHYAEDGGATPKEIAKIKGDLKTLSFVAKAVQIGNPKKERACCGGCEAKAKAKADKAVKKASCGDCDSKTKTGKKKGCCNDKGKSVPSKKTKVNN